VGTFPTRCSAYNLVKRISHIMGFDDTPFEHAHRGDFLIVGMEAIQGVYVQHAGITLDQTADLIAGDVTQGESRHRA